LVECHHRPLQLNAAAAAVAAFENYDGVNVMVMIPQSTHQSRQINYPQMMMDDDDDDHRDHCNHYHYHHRRHYLRCHHHQ
jgi:hypothetical protein